MTQEKPRGEPGAGVSGPREEPFRVSCFLLCHPPDEWGESPGLLGPPCTPGSASSQPFLLSCLHG